ncbi:hypothetical protein CLAFUW4_05687 [Fulvia fulva]|uniref:Uncharacterized protein n=1 Tax=Passalora fulva TaxID=5499 RepID=A0A9Q8P8Y8_PASFU|nr:uncharacterized protein CLAFUR5_05828 [Fulvia fulva]KAK4624519.1 hypothetical protein CLAFUR4_05681 [Fulvia fulva]KAK4625028.1 hypothetical protein CLAFUR0_05690 [Fulvia fulva]UJO17593.1 hypothetical protein CLAFUR5_05828 [Fulvia fulva]WPV15173.1 hypothetical protein CLAFUW4_05687 [Fulvia fulva]WPV29925.1 hypothetical protein CLAFUW7_05686 [Fulvia fulva]
MAATGAKQTAEDMAALLLVIKEANKLMSKRKYECKHRRALTKAEVPKSTLLRVTPEHEKNATDLVQGIRSMVDEYRGEGDSPPEFWPYYDFLRDAKYIADFPGGLDKAMDLVKEFGLEYTEMCGLYGGDHPPSRGEMDYDSTMLLFYHTKVTAWTSTQLLEWELDLDVEGLLTGDPAVTRKTGGSYQSNRPPTRHFYYGHSITRGNIEAKMWPHTLRYLKALHAKKIACIVVPKVAGHRLSVELVDMIIEVSYDKAFTDTPLAISAADNDEKHRRYREE